jgi:hypothetical protein
MDGRRRLLDDKIRALNAYASFIVSRLLFLIHIIIHFVASYIHASVDVDVDDLT